MSFVTIFYGISFYVATLILFIGLSYRIYEYATIPAPSGLVTFHGQTGNIMFIGSTTEATQHFFDEINDYGFDLKSIDLICILLFVAGMLLTFFPIMHQLLVHMIWIF